MRSQTSIFFSLFLFSATFSLFTSTVCAQETAETQITATAHVQTIAEQVIEIVNTQAEPGSAEAETRLEALRSTISSSIDFELLSSRTLGSHWDARSPEEKATFIALLRDMVETSYSRNLGDVSVSNDDYNVVYTDERTRRGRTTVEGRLSAGGEEHFIEIKLENRDTTWAIYDIITDDVSLEESYAESFDRIIVEDGWEGLITRMQERLAELQE